MWCLNRRLENSCCPGLASSRASPPSTRDSRRIQTLCSLKINGGGLACEEGLTADTKPTGNKKGPYLAIRAFFVRGKNQLLDFAFFVDHVLANNRIIFLDLDFVRGSTLVLVGSVEVTSTGARDQTNQFTHDYLP